MTYLIIEIILCLIAAALLGLLVGWLLWGRRTPDTRAFTVQRELDRERIRDLEARLAERPVAPAAAPEPARSVSPLPPVPAPVRADAAAREKPSREDSSREDRAPLAPEVFETATPVSDLEPVPYDDFADAGDGPTEATFTDDPPEDTPEAPPAAAAPPIAAAPLPPEADRPSAPAYDDLKRISGIGPAIESQLAEIGVTTYRQIALFTDDDIERVGAHIDFFADRIRREGWVVQAAALHRQTYGTKP